MATASQQTHKDGCRSTTSSTGLHKLRETDFTGVQGTLDYMRATHVDPETLKPYLFWNPQHYTRNLIDKTDLYELLLALLGAGHEELHPQPQGPELLDGRAHRPPAGAELQAVGGGPRRASLQHHAHRSTIITVDNPVAVDPLNPVHDVCNPREWNQRAVSLHVYSRPFDSCVVYSVEQCSCGEIGLQYTSMYGKLCEGSD